MPSTATITAEQRQAIHELVCLRLIGISDLSKAILRRDFDTAERLGLEFGKYLRLMEDLDWKEKDDRAAVDLTMPAEDLTDTLSRMRAEAEGLLTESPDERRVTAEEEEAKARHRLVIDTCDELIVGPDSREGEAK